MQIVEHEADVATDIPVEAGGTMAGQCRLTLGSVKCVAKGCANSWGCGAALRKKLYELINPGVTSKTNRATSPSSRWTFTSSGEWQPGGSQ